MKLNEIASQLCESVNPNELFELIQNRVYGGKLSQQAYITKLQMYAKQSNSREEFFAAYNSIPNDRFEVEGDKEHIRNEIETYVDDIFKQIEEQDNEVIEQAVNAALASLQTNKKIKSTRDLNTAMMKVAKMIHSVYGK